MSKCTRKVIDSSVIGLSYARENCIAELPSGVESNTSISDFVADFNFSAFDLEYNECEHELITRLTVTDQSEGTIKVRVDRDRGGVITQNVGLQVFAGGDTRWQVNEDPTSVARFDKIGDVDSPSNFAVIVSIEGEVQNGDVFTVFVSDDNFTTVVNRILTVTIDGTGRRVWQGVEVAEYGDFGDELTNERPDRISGSRQLQKATTTEIQAQASFTSNMTQSTMRDFIQGFLYAATRQKPSTTSLNGDIPLQVVEIGDGSIIVSANQQDLFQIGSILAGNGFTTVANNMKPLLVTGLEDQGELEIPSVVESEKEENFELSLVGHRFEVDDVSIVVNGPLVTLVSDNDVFGSLDLNIGEWIFVGGDPSDTRFNQGNGYARIASITERVIRLDQIGWAGIESENGAGKTIEIYFGNYTRNESDPELIKRHSYQFERLLGQDQIGLQSEYMLGQVANELTIEFPENEYVKCEFGFLGIDSEYRNGAEGLKEGERIGAPREDVYNSGDHIRQMVLYVHDNTRIRPQPVFGFVQEASLEINNNASIATRIGRLGGFDMNVGNFEVSGDITAYFTTVEAKRAIRNNADVGFNTIGAFNNSGWVFDIPLLSLSGGNLSIEENEPVLIELEKQAAENENGYTLSHTYFPYLPTVAMTEVEV